MPKAAIKNKPMDLEELEKIEIHHDDQNAERFQALAKKVVNASAEEIRERESHKDPKCKQP